MHKGFPVNIIVITASIVIINFNLHVANYLTIVYFAGILAVLIFYISYYNYLNRKYYLIEL